MNTDSILIEQFIQEHSKVAARALEDLEAEKRAGFFNESPKKWLLKLLPNMNAQGMSEVFEKMNPERLVSLLESMELVHTIASIRMMKQDLAESMLNKLSEDKSASVKKVLNYMDHSVGAHMDAHVFTLTDILTVKDAMAHLKKHSGQISPQLFVLDSDRKFVGVVSLSDLLTEKPGNVIRGLLKTGLTTLSPDTPLQSLISHPQWLEFHALPVVDQTSLFLGAIHLETIRSIVVEPGNTGEEVGQLAMSALGELYRLGLAGLLRSAIDLETLSRK